MNIVLVGFMGTGKTEVAKKLAELIGLKYVSTDELIEKKESRSINEIFQKDGEDYFRELERKTIGKVSELDGLVIDAGGGAMLDEENVRNLKKKGVIICLQARPEVILKRMENKFDRPLLNVANRLERIKELLREREPHYKKADYFIETSELNIQQVAEKIREFLSLWAGRSEKI